MYLVVILAASLMSLAIVSHHICPIYCFQGLFHIRTFCMQRRWVIYDIFTCHGRSNHWWHFFPPILQPDSKYFIRSVPDLRLRHLAADQKKRPILILHRDRQPLEHDTWRLVRWWVFQRRTTVTARAVIFPKLAPISSPIDLPRSCRYSNICIPFISWIVVISLKLKPAAKIATIVWVVTQHYIRGRADCYPCLTATLVWDCHLCLRLPPLFEIASFVWDYHPCLNCDTTLQKGQGREQQVIVIDQP